MFYDADTYLGKHYYTYEKSTGDGQVRFPLMYQGKYACYLKVSGSVESAAAHQKAAVGGPCPADSKWHKLGATDDSSMVDSEPGAVAYVTHAISAMSGADSCLS